jgi:hypothetical protein
MFNFKSILLSFSAVLVLAACGGGGGTAETVGACGAGFSMPSLSYPSSINGTATVAIAALNPTVSAALPAACASTATYSGTGLPAGVSVNTNTGVISGTPTTAGTNVATISLNVPGYTSSTTKVNATIAAAGCAGVGYVLPTRGCP